MVGCFSVRLRIRLELTQFQILPSQNNAKTDGPDLTLNFFLRVNSQYKSQSDFDISILNYKFSQTILQEIRICLLKPDPKPTRICNLGLKRNSILWLNGKKRKSLYLSFRFFYFSFDKEEEILNVSIRPTDLQTKNLISRSIKMHQHFLSDNVCPILKFSQKIP